MKGAVCLSGQLRTFPYCAASIRHFFEGFDFYGFFWKPGEGDVTEQAIADLLPFRALRFEAQPPANSFADLTSNIQFNTNNTGLMFYGIQQVHQLMLDTVKDDEQYDYVFRCRPDLLMRGNVLDFVNRMNKAGINFPDHSSYGGECDQFAGGGPVPMRSLFRIFDALCSYRGEPRKTNAEQCLKFFVDRANVPYKRLPFDFRIMRPAFIGLPFEAMPQHSREFRHVTQRVINDPDSTISAEASEKQTKGEVSEKQIKAEASARQMWLSDSAKFSVTTTMNRRGKWLAKNRNIRIPLDEAEALDHSYLSVPTILSSDAIAHAAITQAFEDFEQLDPASAVLHDLLDTSVLAFGALRQLFYLLSNALPPGGAPDHADFWEQIHQLPDVARNPERLPMLYSGPVFLIGQRAEASYFWWLLHVMPRLLRLTEIPQLASQIVVLPSLAAEYQKTSVAAMLHDRPIITLPLADPELGAAYALPFKRLSFIELPAFAPGRLHPAVLNSFDKLGSLLGLASAHAGRQLWLAGSDGIPPALREWAQRSGIEVVCPDEMTFAERAALARSASTVIGLRHERLVDIGFCMPGCRFIEMVTTGSAALSPFWGLAAGRELQHILLHVDFSAHDLDIALDNALAQKPPVAELIESTDALRFRFVDGMQHGVHISPERVDVWRPKRPRFYFTVQQAQKVDLGPWRGYGWPDDDIEPANAYYASRQRYDVPPFNAYFRKAVKVVGPHLAVAADDAIIAESTRGLGILTKSGWFKRDRRGSLSVPANATSEVRPGLSVVVGTRASSQYFHWMVEMLPRLTVGADLASKHNGTLLLRTINAPFQKETLALVAPGNNVAFTAHDIIECEEVIFPDHVIVPTADGRVMSPAIRIGFEKLLENFSLGDAKPSRRIYISRKDAARRHVMNENELEPILQKHGFEIVTLSGLKVAEQAAIFHDAAIVIGLHGAGLTNIGFCQQGTAVLEILPKGTRFLSPYYNLAGVCGLRYSSLGGTTKTGEMPDINGDYYVSPEALEQAILGVAATY